jgi:ATP/maltotriose-dependent transcriptional regulator MalT
MDWILKLALILTLLPTNCRADVDSLKSVIRTTRSIPTKIDALTELSEAFFYTDTEAAIEYLQQALNLLEEKDFPTKKATALSYYGYALMILGDYDASRDSLHRSIIYFKEVKDPEMIARSLVDVATTYYYESKIEKALVYCRKALDELEGFPKNKAIVYNNMGIFSKNAGKYEEATDYYLSALKCFQEIKDTALMVSANNNIAFLFTQIKFYDRAFYYHNQATELCKSTDDKEGLARSYNGLASVQGHLGQDDEAIKNNKRAIRIFKSLGLKKEALSTRYNLADFYYSRAKFEKAFVIFKAIRPEFEKINAVGEYAATTNAIGLIYYQRKDFDRAQVLLEEALELQKHIENPSMYKSMLLNLTDLYESQGEFDKALETNTKYELVKDSLLVLEEAERIATKEAIYRYEELKKELAESENVLSDEKEQTSSAFKISALFIAGMILLLILIVVSIRIYLRGKKRKEHSEELSRGVAEDLVALEASYGEIFEKVSIMQAGEDKLSYDWVHLLSKRELEILSCLGAGMSDLQIADKLFVSSATVNSHCSRIYKKLNVKNRTEAASVVRDINLI